LRLERADGFERLGKFFTLFAVLCDIQFFVGLGKNALDAKKSAEQNGRQAGHVPSLVRTSRNIQSV
jgi:hypothetical protein